jgi:hypothetical protein
MVRQRLSFSISAGAAGQQDPALSQGILLCQQARVQATILSPGHLSHLYVTRATSVSLAMLPPSIALAVPSYGLTKGVPPKFMPLNPQCHSV